MNNFKKIGLTALASSLAAIGAQAGEMSVSGSFNATYSQQSGNAGQTNANSVYANGTGLGNDKDFTVSGSGELDNGWTFSGYTLLNDALAVSSSALTMDMGSLGTIGTGTQSGGNSTRYDVQTPTAYEEIDDGGGSSLSANFVGNWMDNNSLIYSTPTYDLSGDMTVRVDVEWTPEASGTSPNDGGVVASNAFDNGQSLGLTFAGYGATFGAYAAERETNITANSDSFTAVTFLNYNYGPVSVGISASHHDAGNAGAGEVATADKLVGTANGIFESYTTSIAYNVNDNFSVSYAKAEDTYDSQTGKIIANTATTETRNVTMDMESFQAAYSMGAMSVKAYRTETKNDSYNTNGGISQTTEIALGLAF